MPWCFGAYCFFWKYFQRVSSFSIYLLILPESITFSPANDSNSPLLNPERSLPRTIITFFCTFYSQKKAGGLKIKRMFKDRTAGQASGEVGVAVKRGSCGIGFYFCMTKLAAVWKVGLETSGYLTIRYNTRLTITIIS